MGTKSSVRQSHTELNPLWRGGVCAREISSQQGPKEIPLSCGLVQWLFNVLGPATGPPSTPPVPSGQISSFDEEAEGKCSRAPCSMSDSGYAVVPRNACNSPGILGEVGFAKLARLPSTKCAPVETLTGTASERQPSSTLGDAIIQVTQASLTASSDSLHCFCHRRSTMRMNPHMH